MDDSTPDPEADTGTEAKANPEANGEEGSDAAAETDDTTDAEAETDAEWMMPADRPILELMQSDDVFEPAQIDEERICRGPHAAYRCRELTKYGLLERPMPGVYDITELGEQYLAGELDPSELEPDE